MLYKLGSFSYSLFFTPTPYKLEIMKIEFSMKKGLKILVWDLGKIMIKTP